MQRAADDIEHVMRVVVEEGKAIAVLGVLVVGEHCIPQAASLSHHGHGAVAQRDHLGEAAGLKGGGHQEQVGTRVDAVRQAVVHHKAGCDTAGVVLLRPAKEVDIAGLTHAQADQLQVLAYDVGDDIVHQIQAFLAVEAADHRDDGHIGAHFQAQLLLQGALARGLAGHILHAVVLGDGGIRCRVVFPHIDAV